MTAAKLVRFSRQGVSQRGHGHCILFGNFCITMPARYPCLQTIPSQTRHLITFGRGSIVINSLQSAKKRGGNANQLANGYPPSRRTVPSFAVCSKQWIGWIETSTVTNFVSTNRTHVEACPSCRSLATSACDCNIRMAWRQLT